MPRNSDLSVLSGHFKGAKLQSPQSALTHPMGSREKLALFNMLQPYLEGAKVLDIYAGSGALGIEALSRGAKSVIFVEKTAKICQIIRQNLEQITARGHLEAILEVLPPESRDTADDEKTANLGENATFYNVFAISARDFAENPALMGYFDVILADPPYDRFDAMEAAELPKLLRTGGILALSFPFTNGAPELEQMALLTERQYAAAGIAIYQKR